MRRAFGPYGTQHLQIYLAPLEAGADRDSADGAPVDAVLFHRPRRAEAHHQPGNHGRRLSRSGLGPAVLGHRRAVRRDADRPAGRFVRRLHDGAADPAAGAQLRFPLPGLRQRRFQVRHQHEQGTLGRAHAAPPALRAERPHPALSDHAGAQAQAGRDGHHDQGRGGTARRLHRRRLHRARVPRRSGLDGHGFHYGAKHLAGPGGRGSCVRPGLSHSEAPQADPAPEPATRA